jgi:SAM-dependent methyltransferase
MVTVRGALGRLNAGWRGLSRPPAPQPAPEPAPVREPGAWWELLPFTSHRIQLADGLSTMERGVDASVDIRTDLVVDRLGGSMAGATVLDLGCLEGGFSIEFARRGARRVVGIEAREVSVRRCQLAREILRLDNVEFKVADIVAELEGPRQSFDVVFASGIIYHLARPAEFLRLVRSACTRFAVIDTHVAHPDVVNRDCSPEIVTHESGGSTYRGRLLREFPETTTAAERARLLWASWDNSTSFWPLEEDLVRMLIAAGFGEVTKIDTSDATDADWQIDKINRVLYVCTP